MKQNFTVRQGALEGVETFLAVAKQRSFRRAAAALGVTPSAVSQTVRSLEARVGAALLARTTRSVGLTEAGQRFLERAAPAFDELVAASEAARDLGRRPIGLLRLAVPRAVVPLILEPVIAAFCQPIPRSNWRSPQARRWWILRRAASTPVSVSASSSRPIWLSCD
jgi:DNA-binding transcriptional LysR family regulator